MSSFVHHVPFLLLSAQRFRRCTLPSRAQLLASRHKAAGAVDGVLDDLQGSGDEGSEDSDFDGAGEDSSTEDDEDEAQAGHKAAK